MSLGDNSFSVKVGQWFEAKAEGRFAIVVLVLTIAVASILYLGAKKIGVL